MKYLHYVICGVFLFCATGCGDTSEQSAETKPDSVAQQGMPPELIRFAGLDRERGLLINSPEAEPGYILFTSLTGDDVFLINREGQVVHTWEGDLGSGAEYLMDDGRMVRGARDPDAPRFSGGGMLGRILEYNWDGEITWEYQLVNEMNLLHHDIAVMPNGNVLAIVWELKTPEEARQAGRREHLIPKAGLWPDKIIEIEPQRPSGGKIVWEWNSWDHMVQNENPELPNYGEPSDHPELIDINNSDSLRVDTRTLEEIRQEILKGNEAMNSSPENAGSDMFHTNAIAYNATLDQIVVSTPAFSEVWIIDHSTTTEEARGHTGGKYGKGGDLLYRWGNPESYDMGSKADRILGYQHDVRWIPEGYPGAGNLTVFNNHANSVDSVEYSEVLEFSPVMDDKGNYVLTDGKFGPEAAAWKYHAPDRQSFFAPFISSAHRMKNGNTLINSGPQGRLFEVTPEGKIIWEYWSPYIGQNKITGGAPPQPIGPFRYAVFRATFIPADHPALEGKELTPIEPQPETQKAM